MSETTGKAFGGFLVNNPHSLAWANVIGRLVVNFTTLELLSLHWIDKLASDPLLHEVALERPFSARLDIIDSLIRRTSAPDPVKTQAHELWATAGKISQMRNEVLHNPVAFVWKGRPAEGDHDFVAIPRMRKLRRNPSAIVPSIDLATIKAVVDQIVELAPAIQRALDDIMPSKTQPHSA